MVPASREIEIMDAYIYKAALLCGGCGPVVRREIIKGPYPNGGGEADTAQTCNRCGVALDNPVIAKSDLSGAQHTPTPYRVEYDYRIEHGPIVAGEGFWVAKVNPNPYGGNGKANAAFFVRACNAHDELLARLQDWFTWHADHFEEFADEINMELLCLANDTEPILRELEAPAPKATIDPDDPATLDATAAALIESGDLEEGA